MILKGKKIFKVGDFVRYSYSGYDRVFVVTSVGTQYDYEDNAEYEVLYDGEWNYRYDEPQYFPASYCKHWTPQEGEYCWFWDFKDNLQLRKFEKEENDRYQPYGSVMGFSHCEPFFGELPSILVTMN